MSSAATCPSSSQSRARGEQSPSSPASTPHATCCDLSAASVCGIPAGCQDEGKAGVDRGSPSSTRRAKTITLIASRRPPPLFSHKHVGRSVVCCKFSAIYIGKCGRMGKEWCFRSNLTRMWPELVFGGLKFRPVMRKSGLGKIQD